MEISVQLYLGAILKVAASLLLRRPAGAGGGLCAGEDMPPGSKADWGETG